jgi:predicted glycogen debranching enzyme
MIDIDRETLGDFERAARLEWLETNGIGGWAGSTLSGANTCRHHHLLRLPALATDTTAGGAAAPGRSVALAKLDEMVLDGGRVHDLSCNRFPFVLAAAGLRYLAGFHRDLFPVFEYEVEGIRLRKTVALLDGESTLVVLYEVLAAAGPFVLALRPLLATREAHSLGRAGGAEVTPQVFREGWGLRLRWAAGEEMHLAAAGVDLDYRPDWWYRFELEEERRRGLDFQEDLWTPGLLRRELAAGDRFAVAASAADPAGRGALALLAGERRRRQTLLDRLPIQDELTRVLGLAADQFSLRRAGGARTLAAGYPGGEERTADTLLALPGVLLATGRAEEAKKLLRTYARAATSGTLPDRFPGGAGEPAREALDASLWFFVAAYRYWQTTGDEALTRDVLLPAMAKLATGHERGAGNGLRAAADGLLEAAPGSAAAAQRPGKAVEINALWHNALATLAELGTRLGDTAQAKPWAERARRVQRRFAELFWHAEEGCLYDRVRAAGASDGGDDRDPALRGHQVLAIGLPFPALSKQRGQRLLRTLEERLYTPVGLRDGGGAPSPRRSETGGTGAGRPDLA